MKYLIRNKGSVKVAHIWSESEANTECLMYSRGGMKKENYYISISNESFDICVMCKNNKDKSNA